MMRQPTSTWRFHHRRRLRVETLEDRCLLAGGGLSGGVSFSSIDPGGDDVIKGGSHIVGGSAADPADWPAMASIQSSNQHFCGGTLVAPSAIVTAAHCIVGSRLRDTTVVLGQADLTAANGQRHAVREFVSHPDYNGFTNEADIAIVFLTEPSTQSPLPYVDASTASLATAGQPATILGWGRTRENGRTTPNELREARVNIFSQAAANAPQAYAGRVRASMLAAGREEGGIDTCQGDSGGPLFVHDDEGNDFLAGVTSWGDGCARPNKPGIYTRVSVYADWIDRQLREDSLGNVNFSQDRYATGQPVEVILSDVDLTSSPTAHVELQSDTGDIETLVLNQSAPGRFAGGIIVVDAAAISQNGQLEVSSSGRVDVVYHDLDDGNGGRATATDTARIVVDDFANSAATTALLELSAAQAGEIELSGDEDWFQVSVTESQAYRFDVLLSGSLDDSYLELYDPTGQQLLKFDDDSGDAFASRIDWVAPFDGIVNIAVSAYGNTVGTYELMVQAVEPVDDDHTDVPAGATPLTLGPVHLGEIEVAGDVDWFAFMADTGSTYQFETQLGSLSDTVLKLIADDGVTILAENDDAPDGTFASQIVWSAGVSSTIYVEVSGFGSSLGDYRLQASQLDANLDDHGNVPLLATPASFVTEMSGSIDYANDVDYFSFPAQAGGGYTFSTTLDELNDSFMTIVDRQDQVLAENDDDGGSFASRIAWTAPYDGTFYVVVSGFGSADVGSYRLSAQTDVTLPDDHGNDIGQASVWESLPVTQALAIDYVDDVDWFRLQVVRDRAYQLRTNLETATDAVLTAFGVDGRTELVRSDNDLGEASLTWLSDRTSVIYLEVRSRDSQVGRLTVTVSVPYGDSDLDGYFTSDDLLQALQAGGYNDDVQGNSDWSTGDWNGDGEFDSDDLLLAFSNTEYEPQRALRGLGLRTNVTTGAYASAIEDERAMWKCCPW